MIDEVSARKLWEDEIQRPVSDEDWENLKSLLLGVLRGELATDPDRDVVFETPSQALEELRAAEARARLTWPLSLDWSSPVAPPDSWSRYSGQVLQSRLMTQLRQSALKMLGLEGPILPHEVAPFLARLASAQVWPKTPCEVRNATLPNFDPDGSVNGFTRILAFASGKNQALYTALGLAKMLEDDMGIGAPLGLYWLLTAISITLPWIKTSSNGGPIRMVIPSREVRPEEVASAYARARAAAEGEVASELYGLMAGYRRAARTGEDLAMFCASRRAIGLRWQEIAELWNEAHPERTFASGDTLSRVYRRIQRLASASGGVA